MRSTLHIKGYSVLRPRLNSKSNFKKSKFEVKTGSYVTSGGQKSNFLFRSNFDMKLRPSDAFFDALNISGLSFEVRVQLKVEFRKTKSRGQNDPPCWKVSQKFLVIEVETRAQNKTAYSS